MPSPDKSPEAQNAPTSAAPVTPEMTVTPAAAREGEIRAVDQRIAAVEQAAQGTVAEKQDVVDQVAAAVAEGTSPSTPEEDNVSGGWGAVSGVGAFFTQISETFGELGKKFSEWLKKVMGTEDVEGADPDIDDDDDLDPNPGTDPSPPTVPDSTPERVAEYSEMLTPNAPVFSFPKTFDGDPYASDVPRVRKVHPVTKKHNVPHEGVDIPAPIGTPMFATQDMTMLEPKVGHVKLRLADDTVVEFLHVGKVAGFKAGERIPKGAWFADTGNVGVSSGPHLHFQVNGGETDPIPYLDPGLVASAEEKIQEKKSNGEWVPLESDEHEHGLA